MASPNDRHYTRTHEWAKPDSSDGRYFVGVTAYRATQLGTVTAVVMNLAVNTSVTSGKLVGNLTNSNNSGDLHSPLVGILRNEYLLDQPGQSPNDTVAKPWDTNLFKLEASSQDYNALMTASQYDTYVATL